MQIQVNMSVIVEAATIQEAEAMTDLGDKAVLVSRSSSPRPQLGAQQGAITGSRIGGVPQGTITPLPTTTITKAV
jgi:hypothetical protein